MKQKLTNKELQEKVEELEEKVSKLEDSVFELKIDQISQVQSSDVDNPSKFFFYGLVCLNLVFLLACLIKCLFL